ncbi:3',5'-cyclic-AMP phosphodiesterase [Pseudomonas sp. F1_0610]|uniref:3',5'-cyclic-AMP phosphodiesterase n=1 Tax=Pseudomonas sp. F1_0610 TaxID=3114284 RepID=UPI0039C1FCC3
MQPIATIVQITDSHLFSQPDAQLLGITTLESFKQVVSLVRQEMGEIDLLLVTGDIAQDSSPVAYRQFAHYTEGLASNTRWLPGNHDELLQMQSFCRNNSFLNTQTSLGNWLLLTLNSHVRHQSYGYLADIPALEKKLKTTEQEHIMLAIHHHILPLGSAWLDNINLRNADEFLACIKQFPQVKLVSCGHAHQLSDLTLEHIRIVTTPSTCVQFMPWAEDFKVDTQQPGFRVFQLYADGRFTTYVKRLPENSFLADEHASGY